MALHPDPIKIDVCPIMGVDGFILTHNPNITLKQMPNPDMELKQIPKSWREITMEDGQPKPIVDTIAETIMDGHNHKRYYW